MCVQRHDYVTTGPKKHLSQHFLYFTKKSNVSQLLHDLPLLTGAEKPMSFTTEKISGTIPAYLFACRLMMVLPWSSK